MIYIEKNNTLSNVILNKGKAEMLFPGLEVNFEKVYYKTHPVRIAGFSRRSDDNIFPDKSIAIQSGSTMGGTKGNKGSD